MQTVCTVKVYFTVPFHLKHSVKAVLGSLLSTLAGGYVLKFVYACEYWRQSVVWNRGLLNNENDKEKSNFRLWYKIWPPLLYYGTYCQLMQINCFLVPQHQTPLIIQDLYAGHIYTMNNVLHGMCKPLLCSFWQCFSKFTISLSIYLVPYLKMCLKRTIQTNI